MSDDKSGAQAPTTTKLSDLSPTDKKIADIEAKLALPNPTDKVEEKTGTSPSICGEAQSIDDYVAAMLGLNKKK